MAAARASSGRHGSYASLAVFMHNCSPVCQQHAQPFLCKRPHRSDLRTKACLMVLRPHAHLHRRCYWGDTHIMQPTRLSQRGPKGGIQSATIDRFPLTSSEVNLRVGAEKKNWVPRSAIKRRTLVRRVTVAGPKDRTPVPPWVVPIERVS